MPALSKLSAPPEDMVARMRAETGRTDHLAVVDAPNPLLLHPIVRVLSDRGDCGIAPVPSLIFEWLHEPLADLLLREPSRKSAGSRRGWV